MGSYIKSRARSWRIMFSTIWLKSSFCPIFSNSPIILFIISSPKCSTCAVSMPTMSADSLDSASIVAATVRSSSTSGTWLGVAFSARWRWPFIKSSIVATPSEWPLSAWSVISSVSLNAGLLRLSTRASMSSRALARILSSSSLSMRFGPFSALRAVPARPDEAASSTFALLKSSSSSKSAMASSRMRSSSASASAASRAWCTLTTLDLTIPPKGRLPQRRQSEIYDRLDRTKEALARVVAAAAGGS
mmetsp:Transcript_31693/g.106769  ORF Transcript_31693/g.106769 Transcript_31693/m.106769 type:complete len:247 (-) Transcript_31693:8-748(-)